MDISAHLTPDEIALLAEGKPGEAAERFRSHLAHCKNCFQAYQDAVEFRARALAGKEPHAPPELVRNGRNVPVRRAKKRGVTRAPRGRMIAVTLGGLAALAAVWIFLGPSGFAGPHLSPRERGRVEGLVAAVAEQGPVFPDFPGSKGGELFRGNESSTEVDGTLQKLQERANAGKANPEDFFWLVSAELATGKTDMARLHLHQWNAESEPRWLKLSARLAYQENHLTDAADDLRKVLANNANDHEAELGLGLILIEVRKDQEALTYLRRAQESKDPQIKRRATDALMSVSR